ncbi:hypothetical protein [Jiangella mangrovi]|uniref:Uncharacterized protein n=1 Tax=Jiangella mangrovi TaxID=1524084 RepID=A0A7W9GMX6_9ACTN|nr:hypothetical protein [Jiangella mangrovi]MBB5786652.1 hypothetical protein [Jiangella mangrovi]
MPVPGPVRRRCQELLEPGERIDYLVPVVLAWIGALPAEVECHIAVTDRRIAVLIGSQWRRGGPTEVTLQYPRATRLGPVDFRPVPTFDLGSRSYEIDDEYVAAVHAADAELDGLLPEDPFPGA